MWLKATSVGGPWTPAGTLPASFSKLPPDENWKEVKAALPGRKVDAKQLPTVFVSTTPAELIMLRGAPSYLLVSGTKNLLWVQNTESDVFRVGNQGPVYYLVAGRWFSAPNFKGPWTFATPTLPASSARFPSSIHGRGCSRLSREPRGGRGRAAGAGAADGAREPEGVEGARGEVRGRSEVRADSKDYRGAGRQHRQGHHQGRRPLLHALPGRVVHVAQRGGAMGSGLHDSESDLRDSRRAPRRTTSPTSRWSKTTATATG